LEYNFAIGKIKKKERMNDSTMIIRPNSVTIPTNDAKNLMVSQPICSSNGPSTTPTTPQSLHHHTHHQSHHNDPALYTALFKRKFVKVFTGWDLRATAERRWSRRGNKKRTAQRSKSGNSPATTTAGNNELDVELGGQTRRRSPSPAAFTQINQKQQQPGGNRTSPCLQNCLECEMPVSFLPISPIFCVRFSFEA
jgi:hypothetical protein